MIKRNLLSISFKEEQRRLDYHLHHHGYRSFPILPAVERLHHVLRQCHERRRFKDQKLPQKNPR